MVKDLLIKFLFILATLSFAPSVVSETPVALQEQKIKAGLVYNLIKYTAWPKTPLTPPNQIKNTYNSTTLTICLFGDDPFDGYLAPLQGRTAQQAIISIISVTSIPETASCNAIIVHHSQRDQLPKLLEFVQGRCILTLSDIEKFAELGGMIELARQEEKIELKINKDAVDNSKLVIDARMLKLAKIISKGGAQ
ncbi:MAG: YfiR family protein [Gammaproteobacteria bacterium]|nr:MAG: YfiR family protein [Gammaproteobacteria bacterium]